MSNVELNVVLAHPDAVAPSYSREGDAALDMVAVSREYVIKPEKEVTYLEYDTGIKMAIPEGYVGLVFCRSSNSDKDLSLCNAVGVIDPNYRGTVKARFKIRNAQIRVGDVRLKGNKMYAESAFGGDDLSFPIYEVGDRIVQLLVIENPKVNVNVVDELEDTNRGEGGFGSSGN
jgi:dUTP pyrophosphatase